MKKRPKKKKKKPTESDVTYKVFKWGSSQEPSSGLKGGGEDANQPQKS